MKFSLPMNQLKIRVGLRCFLLYLKRQPVLIIKSEKKGHPEEVSGARGGAFNEMVTRYDPTTPYGPRKSTPSMKLFQTQHINNEKQFACGGWVGKRKKEERKPCSNER